MSDRLPSESQLEIQPKNSQSEEEKGIWKRFRGIAGGLLTLGGILGGRRLKAEVVKSEAEAKKISAEAAKIEAEARQIDSKTEADSRLAQLAATKEMLTLISEIMSSDVPEEVRDYKMAALLAFNPEAEGILELMKSQRRSLDDKGFKVEILEDD